jgi:hypothetical protein
MKSGFVDPHPSFDRGRDLDQVAIFLEGIHQFSKPVGGPAAYGNHGGVERLSGLPAQCRVSFGEEGLGRFQKRRSLRLDRSGECSSGMLGPNRAAALH